MKLTRHQSNDGPRWALDGLWMRRSFTLADLLTVEPEIRRDDLLIMQEETKASGLILPPIEDSHEVWAAGVTYLRSREARREETTAGDIYDKVYAAERPELFFKSVAWRVKGPGEPVRIRADSSWNVPEPEMTLVINTLGKIVGYTAGNDMSSRSIEGENPLYLPQAKIYDGACAIGPGIVLLEWDALPELPISLTIKRDGEAAFSGQTSTAQMRRKPEELVSYLYREMSFPGGVFLMTGTGIVPPESFTLAHGDVVTVRVGELELTNEIGS